MVRKGYYSPIKNGVAFLRKYREYKERRGNQVKRGTFGTSSSIGTRETT